jgi:hypothetical protein
VKIESLTDEEGRAVCAALRELIPKHRRRVEGPLAAALLMARVEEAARGLCGDLVRDARAQHRLTWSQVGGTFGMTMQSAHWRFSRTSSKTATRLRR